MLKVCLVCSLINHPIPKDFDVYVGVDKGALACIKQNIQMDMAIGDFDSVSDLEKEQIKANTKEFIVLPKRKDQSDSEAALDYWVDRASQIVLLGGLGGRLDHQYVNLELMKRYPMIELADANNHLMIVDATRLINKKGFKYVSLFALEDSIISMSDVQYPLNHQVLHPDDLFALSNELLYDQALLTIHQGKLLVIQSKDQ